MFHPDPAPTSLTCPSRSTRPQHLARDLKQTLFQPDSPEAAKIKIDTVKNRHVVLSGGHYKEHVVQWLKAKGF